MLNEWLYNLAVDIRLYLIRLGSVRVFGTSFSNTAHQGNSHNVKVALFVIAELSGECNICSIIKMALHCEQG